MIKKFKELKDSNLAIAIGLNLFFFFLAIIFCDIKYEVSDDFMIAAILSGAFGDNPNPMCMYINPILAYALLPLYKIFPSLSWYLILQLGLSLIAFIGITYMLFEKMSKKIAAMLSILFIVFFSNDAYILVQFTKTAMIVGMSGAILYVWAVFYNKSKKLMLVSGFLCISGSMIRFSVVYVMGGFILILLLFEFRRVLAEHTPCKKILKSVILPGTILIIITFGLQNVYEHIYLSSEEYKEFYEYNSARASVVDRSDYGYEAYKKELDEIGVSENDYLAARTWNFGDPDYFSEELMRKIGNIIAEFKEQLKIDWNDILVKLQDRKIQTYEVFWGCFLLIMISVFFQKNYLKYAILFGAIGILYEIYFFLRERVVYRVEYGVFFCVFLCLLYVWDKKNERILINSVENCRICVIIISIICLYKLPLYVPDNSYKNLTSNERKTYIENVFLDSASYDSRKYKKVTNKDKEKNLLLEEIKNNGDKFYFLDFQTTIQTLYYEWDTLKNLPIDYFDNFAYFGGVTTNFPDVKETLSKKGVSNPMRSLTEEGVFLVDNSSLMIKLNYIREHYYPNARAELYKEVSGYQVWKLYKE